MGGGVCSSSFKGDGRRFCLGGRIYLIPCRASYILSRTILNNKMNSSFPFKSSCCNSSHNSNRPVQNTQRGKELNKFFPPPPQTEATTFAFSYVFILLLWASYTAVLNSRLSTLTSSDVDPSYTVIRIGIRDPFLGLFLDPKPRDLPLCKSAMIQICTRKKS